MRGFVLRLLVLLMPTLASAAVDPAARKEAIAYERSIQSGNKTFRQAKQQAEALVAAMLTDKPPRREDVAAAVRALEKSIFDFQNVLNQTPPPEGLVGGAYTNAVSDYLKIVSQLVQQDYPKALAALEQPGGDFKSLLDATAGIRTQTGKTQPAIDAVSQARKAFLAAYEITSADLAQAPTSPVSPPSAPTAQTPAAPAAPNPTPAAGPTALYQTIREGETAFRESMRQVQRKLLPKLQQGGEIAPTEVEATFAEIQAGLEKFESNVAAAQVPDDPESQAFAESAGKLVAATKKVDFAGIAKIFTDPNLSAAEKQAQLIKKLTSLEAGTKEEFKAFNRAKAALRTKHGIIEPGEVAQTPPM